jgi:phosphonate transport system substrate-binding protein
VVPQETASILARRWTPFLAYLSAKTSYTLVFQTAKDNATFEERLAAGSYDAAYMNPAHYVRFHRAPGYYAFAKEKDTRLEGIVVVQKDAPYRTLADLGHHTLAFPAATAFAGSTLVQAQLNREGVPFAAVHLDSHDSVYLSVARGLYIAGGGIRRTLEGLKPGVRQQLRILSSTPSYTPHAFAAHPRVPAVVVASLRQAMEQMAEDSQGQQLLKSLLFTGFEAAHDVEWDDVRTLFLTFIAE